MESPLIFVYGSLRPDDDSGMPWTRKACEGMIGQKATVPTAKLFHDQYAVAVLKKSAEEQGQVVGWVLTHADPQVFEEKLKDYDRIEGYNSKDPDSGYYKRDVTQAILNEELRAGQVQKIGEAGETVRVFIYHRTNAVLDVAVPDGDWLKRTRD